MSAGALALVLTSTLAGLELPPTLDACRRDLAMTFDAAITWEARARTTLLDLEACQASRQALQEVIQAPGAGPLAWVPDEAVGRSLDPYSPWWRDVGLVVAGLVLGATAGAVLVAVLAAG
jgi:hypothetical protein